MKYLKGILILAMICMLWMWFGLILHKNNQLESRWNALESEWHGRTNETEIAYPIYGLDKATNGDFLVQIVTNIVVTNCHFTGSWKVIGVNKSPEILELRRVLSPSTYGYTNDADMPLAVRAVLGGTAVGYQTGIRHAIRWMKDKNFNDFTNALEIAEQIEKSLMP